MSRRTAAVAVVVCLAVLAGCGALDDVGAPTVDGEHPFAGETVTVAVDGTDRERALVAEALTHWERNASTYVGYNVTFRVVAPSATDSTEPDVRMRFRANVTNCGDADYSAGCAPRLNASTGVDRPAAVSIKRGLSNESTELVVRHETGHLLGLGHDDEPRAVMRHERELATRPQPNATERGLPWDDAVVTVAVKNGTVPEDERAAYQDEVTYGLDYFRAGADGAAPENLTVRRVADPADADVVVDSVERHDCRSDAGSCVLVEGTDPDGDGAIETYTRVDILLVDVDTEAASWHVARQFARAVGITGGELPDPLRDSTYTERRSDWHG